MALTEIEEQGNVLFLGIIGNRFNQKVSKDTPGAKYRLFTDSDGVEYHIHEILHKNLKGNITNLKVIEGKYGPQLMIEIENEGEKARLYINTATAYFGAFVKRLPNIDLTAEVTLVPYNFTTETGKTLKGITIYQDGSKLNNYYYDPINKVHINLPVTKKPWDELTTIEQKAYYLLQTQFFIESVGIIAQGIPVHPKQLEAYDHVAKLGTNPDEVTSDTLFGRPDPEQPEL